MILIVGANGFFGNQLQKSFLRAGISFFPTDITLKNENYFPRNLIIDRH